MFAEDHARWLLVFHAITACAGVAAATHLVLWLRRWLRGARGRGRGVRVFALTTFLLFAATVVSGFVVYPTYRTRVRAEYLDDPVVLVGEASLLAASRARREPDRQPATVDDEGLVERAQQAVRWFDVKEYWGLFATVLAGALALILWTWDPHKADRSIAVVATWMSVAIAGSGWLATIIGLFTVMRRGL